MKIDGSDERILFSEYKTERPSWNQNSLELVFSFKNSKNDFSKIKIIDIIGNEILTIKTKNKHSILEPHWFYIQQ